MNLRRLLASGWLTPVHDIPPSSGAFSVHRLLTACVLEAFTTWEWFWILPKWQVAHQGLYRSDIERRPSPAQIPLLSPCPRWHHHAHAHLPCGVETEKEGREVHSLPLMSCKKRASLISTFQTNRRTSTDISFPPETRLESRNAMQAPHGSARKSRPSNSVVDTFLLFDRHTGKSQSFCSIRWCINYALPDIFNGCHYAASCQHWYGDRSWYRAACINSNHVYSIYSDYAWSVSMTILCSRVYAWLLTIGIRVYRCRCSKEGVEYHACTPKKFL